MVERVELKDPFVQQVAKKLEKLGVKVVFVTNANVDWTIAKFDQHNLWRYTDNLVIADENGHKGVRDWYSGRI